MTHTAPMRFAGAAPGRRLGQAQAHGLRMARLGRRWVSALSSARGVARRRTSPRAAVPPSAEQHQRRSGMIAIRRQRERERESVGACAARSVFLRAVWRAIRDGYACASRWPIALSPHIFQARGHWLGLASMFQRSNSRPARMCFLRRTTIALCSLTPCFALVLLCMGSSSQGWVTFRICSLRFASSLPLSRSLSRARPLSMPRALSLSRFMSSLNPMGVHNTPLSIPLLPSLCWVIGYTCVVVPVEGCFGLYARPLLWKGPNMPRRTWSIECDCQRGPAFSFTPLRRTPNERHHSWKCGAVCLFCPLLRERRRASAEDAGESRTSAGIRLVIASWVNMCGPVWQQVR